MEKGGQPKGRPLMLLFPGGRSARIPYPRDPSDLLQRIIKFSHGAVQPDQLKAFEKDEEGFHPQVDLQDFFDIYPEGGVTLYITNGEDFSEELFRKPGLISTPPPTAASSQPQSPTTEKTTTSGERLMVDEEQLNKLVQLARNLNRGRDDFWQSSFGPSESVSWSVFIKSFCCHFRPQYQRLSRPENVQEEMKLLLDAQDGHVTLATWQRFTSWFHPIEKVVQIVEDLRDRGLIYHKGFVKFRRQEEEGKLIEEIMQRDHSAHGVLLRLSETYSHQHGIWLTIVQRREGSSSQPVHNYLIENCPLIYYKLFSGFTIPTYTGNQVFDSIDKLVNHVIIERTSTMKEYVTKELREALRSSTRILPLRHFYYALKRKEIEARGSTSANQDAARNLNERNVQERMKLYGLQVQQTIAEEETSIFVAVSLQIWGTVHNATYLQTKVTEWLLAQDPSTKLGEEAVLIGELLEGKSIQEYCENLAHRTPSGDVLFLAAVADVFQRPVVLVTSLEGDRHVVQITPTNPITPRPVLIAHIWPQTYQPLEPSAIDPLRPWLIKPHELEEIEPIGRGAQASVLRGRYKGLPVAIKRIVLTDNADLTEHAFERELTILQQLRCPALIQFLGACLESPPRLVFEFMSGGSLHDLLHSQLSFREALQSDPKLLVHLAHNIATGMQFLHASDITHCDLTPNNVLLDERRKAKVADFGLARLLIAPGHFDQTGHFAYVAPEIWEAKTAAHFSFASDVFSFGVILWEMWARRLPYEKQFAENVGRSAEVPRAYISDVRMGWRPTIPDDVPADWQNLIQLCWHHDPTRRPTFAGLIAEGGPLDRLEQSSSVPPSPRNAVPLANTAFIAGPPSSTSEEDELKKLSLRDVY